MWFLLESFRKQIEKALESALELTAVEKVSLEKYSARLGKMTVIGRNAVIPIEGILTQKRDYYAAYYGGGNTLYPDVTRSILEANGDPSVDSISLEVGFTPGGSILGMFEAMDAIRASGKPVQAYVKHGALSAGYGLVSQAGRAIAASRATQFGSVGVAYDASVYPYDVRLSSSEAPKKRPDLTTDEGKQVIVEQLDKMHALFAESIAAGRDTSVEKVNKNFGRGALVLAGEAISAGMIDAIAEQQLTAAGGKTEAARMDLTKLKAEYPELYAAIVAEGVAQGIAKERDRVTAHLVLGKESGAMDMAMEAVENGTEMTNTLTAKYIAAGMNKRDINSRQEDDPDTGDIPDTTPDTNSLEKETTKVWDEMFGAEDKGGGK